MKIIVKKTVLILLTVLALLSAASCSGSGDPQPGRTEEEQKAPAGADVGSSVSEMSPGTSADAGEIYARELIMVPDADVYLSQAVKAGGSIYMYGKISRETPVLYRMDIGSRQVERVELPPERVDTICPSVVGEIGALCISEEGEFIAATLGSDGTWSRLTLPAAEEYGYDTLMQAVPVSKGYVVFTTGSILAVDMQGGLIKELGSYYREAVCVPLEDGRAVIAAGLEDSPDPEAPATEVTVLGPDFSAAEKYTSHNKFTGLFGCAEDENSILCHNGGTVFSFDYKNDTLKPLINTELSGMIPAALIRVDEGCYFSIANGAPYIWQPQDTDSLVTLSLAAYGLDPDLDSLIGMYNESGGKYKINVVDYSAFDEGGTPGQGLERLRADIISGRTPDLFDISRLPAELYAARGIFMDLKPYLEDTGAPVSYSQLIPSAAGALEYGGGLFYICPQFEAVSVCGSAGFLGEKSTWTPEEFFDAVEGIPPGDVFGPETTKRAFLTRLLGFMGDELIDVSAHTCSFDRPDIAGFLEFASGLPDDLDPRTQTSQSVALAYAGIQPLMFESIGNSAISFMSFADAAFGGEARYVGFPTRSSSGVALDPVALVGVSAASQHTEGVMDFIYFLLSDGAQLSLPYCPIVQSCFDRQIEKWTERYTDPKYPPVLYTFYDNASVEIEGKTDPDMAVSRIRRIVDSIDCTTLYDETVLEIMLRESRLYFGGQIPAEQAAANIQSKVQIYISEQY